MLFLPPNQQRQSTEGHHLGTSILETVQNVKWTLGCCCFSKTVAVGMFQPWYELQFVQVMSKYCFVRHSYLQLLAEMHWSWSCLGSQIRLFLVLDQLVSWVFASVSSITQTVSNTATILCYVRTGNRFWARSKPWSGWSKHGQPCKKPPLVCGTKVQLQ